LQYLLKWKGYSHAHDSWKLADQVHVTNLIAKFHQENPKSVRVLEINSCDEDREETMPYSSPYNNASSNLGTTIIASFFEDAPRILNSVPQPQTPIICRRHFEGPQFSCSQDRGRTSESEVGSSSDPAGEIYFSYGSPVSLVQSTFSFDVKVTTTTPDHRPNR
jgi:Chromo (CHRromatin Organisation MOdifier) domain